MVTKTSMNIQAVDQSGNKVQKTLTDINPDASPAKLKEFAEALNGLTNNVYGSANRIEVKNLGGGNLLDPNLSWSNSSITKTMNYRWSEIKRFTMDGENGSALLNIHQASPFASQIPYIKSNATSVPVVVGAVRSAETGEISQWSLYLAAGTGYDNVTDGDTLVPSLYGDIVIAVDPDDTYDGAEITLTITEG